MKKVIILKFLYFLIKLLKRKINLFINIKFSNFQNLNLKNKEKMISNKTLTILTNFLIEYSDGEKQ